MLCHARCNVRMVMLNSGCRNSNFLCKPGGEIIRMHVHYSKGWLKAEKSLKSYNRFSVKFEGFEVLKVTDMLTKNSLIALYTPGVVPL